MNLQRKKTIVSFICIRIMHICKIAKNSRAFHLISLKSVDVQNFHFVKIFSVHLKTIVAVSLFSPFTNTKVYEYL